MHLVSHMTFAPHWMLAHAFKLRQPIWNGSRGAQQQHNVARMYERSHARGDNTRVPAPCGLPKDSRNPTKALCPWQWMFLRIQDTITKNQMMHQLVPPNDHRRNIAEKAIQTFKVHFISILSRADKLFPLQLWCQLLPQAEHTLNMLHPSRMPPAVSVYAYLWGQHYYNVNPYAPLGCKVEVYLYPGIWETWAPLTASG